MLVISSTSKSLVLVTGATGYIGAWVARCPTCCFAGHFKPGRSERSVNGTVGILESAKKFGDKVKRVVVTSSCATISQTLPEPKTFDEENWNGQSVKEVEEKGKGVPNMVKYRASKTLTERGEF
ncbi:d-lactaldehyde dehydrogenase [Moniliophthora roreri MCA 2997]|uniref:D-lactaldehyde dehydrogenase n=1 Tax=Moniliophthora roreri (strain MCA 2997) TaxID=1381753 RepID=V2Y2X1_MONRO|nr:d-lactaldehyde dehydrogenase [Moniliophthora roreri MCA 2997]